MPTTLKTAVLDYLRSGNASPGTRQEYHTTLRKWKQRGRGVPLEKLGHREIREFLDWVYEHAVEEQGTNPGRTANKAREQLRAVAWAWDQELIETPPRFPKRRHPRDVTGRHYLSKAEINALYFASHKLKRPRGWDSPHTVGRYGPLPASLPREEVRHELSPEQRRCPGCGEVRQEIGSETSEQLEFVPASYKVLVHVRVKYACRHCQENVTIVAKPVRPIDKGLPGPGLIAHTVLAKYGDHMPLYRQDDDSTRHGWCSAVARFATGLPLPPIWLSRFTSGCASWCCSHGWCTPTILRRSCSIRRCARPERLVLGLHRRHRTSLHGVRLHHKPRARRPGEVPGRLSRLPASRRLRRLQRHLSGSSGKIVEVACWTHCRRYWWEARTSDSRRAHQALAYIARLYKNERALAGASDEQRCAARQQHALPILNRFGQWLQREQQEVLPKSPIAAAITYTRNQWQALQRYTEAGYLSIDNNLSERTVKTPAIGRKNWLFVASERGGHRAARLFSLTASCKANGVEPFAYLRDLFIRLPLLGDSPAPEQLDELLPDRWLAANPQHRWRIDDLRRAERSRGRGELAAHLG